MQFDWDFDTEDGKPLTGVFEVEPYCQGGWEEAPSGGYATMEEIKQNGLIVPKEDWELLGVDQERVHQIEENAYRAWEAWEENRWMDRGDEKYHELKDEGLI